MPSNFKIFTISVLWEKPKKVKSILIGKREIKPTFYSSNSYEYDIVMYEKYDENYYQFCLQTEYVPFLKSESGDYFQEDKLFNIEDDFWIIKGEWNYNYKGVGYHKCPTINTAGTIEIGLSSNGRDIGTIIKINVNPNIQDFDFESLKNDFEGEFWNLLTFNKSKLNTTKKELKYGDKVFRLAETQRVVRFLNYFDKISRNPKSELKFTKHYLPIEKVKPIPETYKKIAQKGLNSILPSKSFSEHYDIYENRFICLMLHKIFQIADNNIKFSQKQIEKLVYEIEIGKSEISRLTNPPKLKKAELLTAIKNQENHIERLKQNWADISSKLSGDKNDKNHNLRVSIKYSDYNSYNYYWCFINNEFCLVKFPDTVLNYLEEKKEYDLTCSFVRSNQRYTAKSGKQYPIWFVNSINCIQSSEVSEAEKTLSKQKSNFAILEQNDFQQFSILTSPEKRKAILERNNQIETIKRRIKKIEKQLISLKKFYKEYSVLTPYIRTKLNTPFFKKVNIKNVLEYKPSMAFIQNLYYRNAYNLYNEILASEGIDLKVFGLYEQLTNYGIREMPILYELWVLISTISVLNNEFHLKHNPEDLNKLLETITPDSRVPNNHITIRFENLINKRQILLHYQKQLENNKRPDILLEIRTDRKVVFLILDAKYKNFNYKLSATYEARSMLEKYGLNSNFSVFVLHPCNDLNKGDYVVKLTNFGGEKVYFENDEVVFPFHKFGYLKVKPLQTENLKKVIGMALEYLVEDDYNAKKDGIFDPKPGYEMICLSCGNDNVSMMKQSRRDNRYHYTCECLNEECEHKIYIDYCWNCKTKLYKHGSYWDYHRTSIWSIFDIHCPNCGMTVADMPTN